ncbi:Aminopeptidase YwaD [Geodia barretti]|uniref:Aminopeptidase YwaD n=1 Tax=Geodia barretti TaxID=519541 RepID=A0AA35W0B5_GEOBA|nr:Aminopeptidase YwaD [Geodia barretti]
MPKLIVRSALWNGVAVALIVSLVACSNAPEDAPAAQATVAPVVTATLALQATAAPQATSTSAPEPTAVPAPLPTVPILPAVVAATPTTVPTNPEAERLSAIGLELLTDLTADYSPRESGTDGELAAAEFIGRYLEDMGYVVEFQPVEVEYIPWSEEFVSLIGDGRPDLRAVPMAMSGLGDVTAPLVSVGKAFEEDIPDEGLDGVIALIERGQITFEEKVNRVANAGAVAAIIYNNERGNFRGALQSDGPIPAASLSLEEGEDVLQLLEDETELEARVTIEMSLLNSQNVIAELDGQSTECGVVVMGGHYDSVADTQAAGDNGTGRCLASRDGEELAEAHSEDESLPYALRFIFFGVEEIGLYGSRHYVDNLSEQEHGEIIAMLNFDAMGKGEAAVVGSDDLVDRAINYADGNGITLNRSNEPAGFGSDHASFLNADIPALFFFGDDFSIINSPDDVLEEVEPSIMGANMVVGLGMLEEFECKPQG